MIVLIMINHILEAIGIYAFTFCLYTHRRNVWVDRSAVFLTYVVLFSIYQAHNLNLNIAAMLTLYCVLFRFLIHSSWRESIHNSMISYSLIAISELIVDVGTYLFREGTEFEYGSIKDLLIATIATKVVLGILFAVVIYVLKRVAKSNHSFHEMRFVTCSLSVLVLSLIAIQNLGFSIVLENKKILWVYVILVSLIVFSVVIIALTAYLQIEQSRMQDIRTEMQRKEDENHYDHLITQLNQEQQVIIHDFKRHLQMMDALIERKEYQEVQKYIRRITMTEAITGNGIVNDNRTFSVLLARYRELCEKQKIQMALDVGKCKLSFLTPDDVTSLFCNLLDNAMEACGGCLAPYIDLRISWDSDQEKNIIIVINNCLDKPSLNEKGEYISRKMKSEKHGYGLRSIERVIKKYNGMYQSYYDEEDRSFHTVIIL